MSEKRVTVSVVQITQDTRDAGTMVREETYFCLPGADYSQTCAAILAAKFEWVNTVQEAFDAKLAEGRNELPQKDAVTVSVVQITQDTRDAGTMVREETYFCLPGADYSQTCAASMAAQFEWVNTVQEAFDAKLAEGRNELPQKDAVTVSVVQITQDTRDAGTMVREETSSRLPGADYNQICAALLAAKFKEFDTMLKALDAKLAEGCNE